MGRFVVVYRGLVARDTAGSAFKRSADETFLSECLYMCLEVIFRMKENKKYADAFRQIAVLCAGALLMAIAVVVYFDQLGVVAGGVTGLAVLFNHMWNVPMWVVNLLFNVPLFLIGIRVFEFRIFGRMLLGTALLTFFLGIVPAVNILTGDMLVDIVVGSVLMGAGLGLVFLSQASTGGVDMLATIINRKIRYISIPKIMGIVDGVIVLIGAGIFGVAKGIYAIIAVYIIQRVADEIMEGPNHAKLLYIISKEPDACAAYIIHEISRGVTFIEVTGAYTNVSKHMILTVVSGKEMVQIKQKIYQIDEKAICFVGDIREAFGEGFTKYSM